MKILLIDHYAGSPGMGMEYRPYYLAREWNGMGHDVTVVAADFSHLRAHNPELRAPVEERVVEQVRFVFLNTPSYVENDRKRYKNVYRFVMGLRRNAELLAQRYSPDLVIASSTYPLDIYPARKIAALADARLVYEVHDIHPESYVEIYGYSPWHPIMQALGHAVKYAYRHADRVVSILPRAGEHMRALGFDPAKCTWVPNGIEPDETPKKQPQRHIDLITRYRGKGYFIVMYLGGFAPANALDALVESAARAPREALYMLVGNGLYKTPLKRYARQHNLSNIMYLDAVDKDQVPSILALADCLYIGALPLKVYRYGVGMNKLYDYMDAARPVICAMDVPDNPVELAGCGLVVPEGDAESIARAVADMQALTPGERAAMGERGRAWVRAHNQYPLLAKEYLAACEPLPAPQQEPGKAAP